MFCKFRWLELLYCWTGHLVLACWCGVFAWHVLRLDPLQQAALVSSLGTARWPLIIFVLILGTVYVYALICSLAPLLLWYGKCKIAERIYTLTLRWRKSMPITGRSARIDFWNISLANCYREQGRLEEAEELYKTVIERQQSLTGVERITNYGLKGVAQENYVLLLRRHGHNARADFIEANTDSSGSIMRVKYLATSILLLVFGGVCAIFENIELDKLFNLMRSGS